jgi:hypothetical protein
MFPSSSKRGDTYIVGSLRKSPVIYKGPNRVRVSHPSSEEGNRSCFRKVMFLSTASAQRIKFVIWNIGKKKSLNLTVKIILKPIFEKYTVEMWNGLKWPKISVMQDFKGHNGEISRSRNQKVCFHDTYISRPTD